MNYLALTIGPIIKTLMQARKTRELWAASYLLSRLMEHLCKQLDANDTNILIPKIPVLNVDDLYGAGIYPDRLFMKAGHFFDLDTIKPLPAEQQLAAVEQLVQQKIDAAIQALGEDCLPKKKINEDVLLLPRAIAFWQQFFRIRFVVHDLLDIAEGKLSRELSNYLDCLELEDTCFGEEPEVDFLNELFKPDQFFDCALTAHIKSGKGKYEPIMPGVFPSTSDIAAYELYCAHPEQMSKLDFDPNKDKHEVFYQEMEANGILKKSFRPRHKYFCLVQADGDSISEAIKQLNTESDYHRFSNILANYGVKAADKINDYGGKPIYIGGDDLLFLCPLRSDKGSVFDLISELDVAFPSADLHPDTSLSFGLNVIYYKYPLFEAIGDAYVILKEAKDFKTVDGKKKNAVSFRFTKHSGSAFDATFSKDFLKAAKIAISVFEKHAPQQRQGIVSSLIYKLFTLQQLLTDLIAHVGTADEAVLRERLRQTVDHFFNEWKNAPGFKEQKEAIIDLLCAAIKDASVNDKAKNALKLFYPVMRLIQFIIAPSNQNTPQHDTENITQTAG